MTSKNNQEQIMQELKDSNKQVIGADSASDLDQLMQQYLRKLNDEPVTTSKTMLRMIIFFDNYYRNIRHLIDGTYSYHGILEDIVVVYCTNELDSCQQSLIITGSKEQNDVENNNVFSTAQRLINMLALHLEEDEHIIHVLLKLKSIRKPFGVCVLRIVFKYFLTTRTNRRTLSDLEYTRRMLAFRVWRKISERTQKECIVKIANEILKAPKDFLKNRELRLILNPVCVNEGVTSFLIQKRKRLDNSVEEYFKYLEKWKNTSIEFCLVQSESDTEDAAPFKTNLQRSQNRNGRRRFVKKQQRKKSSSLFSVSENGVIILSESEDEENRRVIVISDEEDNGDATAGDARHSSSNNDLNVFDLLCGFEKNNKTDGFGCANTLLSIDTPATSVLNPQIKPLQTDQDKLPEPAILSTITTNAPHDDVQEQTRNISLLSVSEPDNNADTRQNEYKETFRNETKNEKVLGFAGIVTPPSDSSRTELNEHGEQTHSTTNELYATNFIEHMEVESEKTTPDPNTTTNADDKKMIATEGQDRGDYFMDVVNTEIIQSTIDFKDQPLNTSIDDMCDDDGQERAEVDSIYMEVAGIQLKRTNYVVLEDEFGIGVDSPSADMQPASEESPPFESLSPPPQPEELSLEHQMDEISTLKSSALQTESLSNHHDDQRLSLKSPVLQAEFSDRAENESSSVKSPSLRPESSDHPESETNSIESPFFKPYSSDRTEDERSVIKTPSPQPESSSHPEDDSDSIKSPVPQPEFSDRLDNERNSVASPCRQLEPSDHPEVESIAIISTVSQSESSDCLEDERHSVECPVSQEESFCDYREDERIEIISGAPQPEYYQEIKSTPSALDALPIIEKERSRKIEDAFIMADPCDDENTVQVVEEEIVLFEDQMNDEDLDLATVEVVITSEEDDTLMSCTDPPILDEPELPSRVDDDLDTREPCTVSTCASMECEQFPVVDVVMSAEEPMVAESFSSQEIKPSSPQTLSTTVLLEVSPVSDKPSSPKATVEDDSLWEILSSQEIEPSSPQTLPTTVLLEESPVSDKPSSPKATVEDDNLWEILNSPEIKPSFPQTLPTTVLLEESPVRDKPSSPKATVEDDNLWESLSNKDINEPCVSAIKAHKSRHLKKLPKEKHKKKNGNINKIRSTSKSRRKRKKEDLQSNSCSTYFDIKHTNNQDLSNDQLMNDINDIIGICPNSKKEKINNNGLSALVKNKSNEKDDNEFKEGLIVSIPVSNFKSLSVAFESYKEKKRNMATLEDAHKKCQRRVHKQEEHVNGKTKNKYQFKSELSSDLKADRRSECLVGFRGQDPIHFTDSASNSPSLDESPINKIDLKRNSATDSNNSLITTNNTKRSLRGEKENETNKVFTDVRNCNKRVRTADSPVPQIKQDPKLYHKLPVVTVEKLSQQFIDVYTKKRKVFTIKSIMKHRPTPNNNKLECALSLRNQQDLIENRTDSWNWQESCATPKRPKNNKVVFAPTATVFGSNNKTSKRLQPTKTKQPAGGGGISMAPAAAPAAAAAATAAAETVPCNGGKLKKPTRCIQLVTHHKVDTGQITTTATTNGKILTYNDHGAKKSHRK